MDARPAIPLPEPLQRAVDLVRETARVAAAQTVDSLGLAAMASTGIAERDALLGAQYELNRKLPHFSAGFDAALHTEAARRAGLLTPTTPDTGRGGPSPDELVARWESLALVGEDEVELQLGASRFARSVAHLCEWEIREVEGFMAALLRQQAGLSERVNPLEPEVISQALARAVEPLSERADVRLVLCAEIGRSLAPRMRETYAVMAAMLRQSGIQPLGLSLRSARSPSGGASTTGAGLDTGAAATVDGPGGGPGSRFDTNRTGRPSATGPAGSGFSLSGTTSAPATGPATGPSSGPPPRSAAGRFAATAGGGGALPHTAGAFASDSGHATAGHAPPHTGPHSGPHSVRFSRTAADHVDATGRARAASTRGPGSSSLRGGLSTSDGVPAAQFDDPRLGVVPPDVMGLIRALSSAALADEPAGAAGAAPDGADGAAHQPTPDQPLDLPLDLPADHPLAHPPDRSADARHAPHGLTADGAVRLAPNLVAQHRAALRRVATGELDHRIIDIVASLFDAVLSDGKVPAPIARALARLQLPVLRAALGDPSFFALREHPVRRLINRIATLGTALDELASPASQALLRRVDALVAQLVQGDFEQRASYERTLQALDRFVAAQAQAAVHAQGAADRVLAHKEGQLKAQHHFGRALDQALAGLPVPDYLRRFVAETWSRVIAQAEQAGDGGPGRADGAAGGARRDRALPLAESLRETGRELLMSVQPKGSAALRQAFVRQLPALMKALNHGLDRIQAPPALRQAFFAQLLPAHAESLKGQPLSTLEHNLLARQVADAMALPLPTPAELPPGAPLPDAEQLDDCALASVFSPDEAQAVGLVPEQAVDWKGQLDIDLSAEPELQAVDIDLGLGGTPPEAPEPSRGPSLVEHVRIGVAYRMQLGGRWQKVRLAHVSPGRGFFVFSHGDGDRQLVSLTRRMLVRLCDSGRLAAFEHAHLLERASVRARRQLAALSATLKPTR